MTWDNLRNGFQSVTTLSKAVTFVKHMRLCHSWYSHYTNLDVLKKIIETGKLRMTRADSLAFDDTLEQKRFGDVGLQKRLYFSCFTHEREENAAMWGLYCPPTYKAVRMVFHRYDLLRIQEHYRHKENWIAGVVRGYPMFSDVVYAGQFGSKVENNLSSHAVWEFFKSERIEKFEEKKSWPYLTGFVKDYEWQFEKETRFFLKTKDILGEAYYDIAFPISEMNRHTVEITLSPWADDEEAEYAKSQIDKSVLAHKYAQRIRCVRSSLSKGLGKWAAKRGV